MAQYRLTYLNSRGRAELIRFIFAAAGQDFEDNRISWEKWEEMRAADPFEQIPILEITENGATCKLTQTMAVARFLARRFNLYGNTEFEKGEVDMFADQISDLAVVITMALSGAGMNYQPQENSGSKALLNSFKLLETRLGQSKSGYLVGDSLTWVDLYFCVVVEWLSENREAFLSRFPRVKENDEALLDQFPKIYEHDAKIRGLPLIASWLDKRPVSRT